MKKLLLMFVAVLFVLSSTLSYAYAADLRTEVYQKLKDYYLTETLLTDPDQIMAVEALGLEVEEQFSIYNIKNQDFETMYLSTFVKTLIAMSVSGIDLRDVNGKDLSSMLNSYVQSDGSLKKNGFTADVYTQVWGVWALYIIDSPYVERSAKYLASLQAENGGFGSSGWEDVFTTAQCVNAMSLVNKTKYQIYLKSAVSFILSFQKEDAAFDNFGKTADNQASALFGLLAYNRDGVKGNTYSVNNNHPYDYLLSLQNEDGSFGYNYASTNISALAIGSFENNDFFKHAKEEYNELKAENDREDIQKRKASYNQLYQYYQDKANLDSYDEYIAVGALGLDAKTYQGIDLINQDFQDLSEADLAKTIIIMIQLGKNPSEIGNDLVALLESYVKADGSLAKGEYPVSLSQQVWCAYALYCVNSTKLQIVTDNIANQQAQDGSFGYIYNGYNADLDTTGWVIDVLSLTDKQKYLSILTKAISFVKTQQQETGAFGIAKSEWDVFPNANTQASVLLGLINYDKKGLDDGAYSKSIHHPFDIVLMFQNKAGSFGWSDSQYNAMATQQVALMMGNYYNGNFLKNMKNLYNQLINAGEEEPQEQTVVVGKEPDKDIRVPEKESLKNNISKPRQTVGSKPQNNISSESIKTPKETLEKETSTVTQTIEKDIEVNNENPYIKYGTIIAGGIVILAMIKIAVSAFIKKRG